MNKSREDDIYVNPVICRPRVLRSALPVLISRAARGRAATGIVHYFRHERESDRPR